MLTTLRPALSRRLFLFSAASVAGALALPLPSLASVTAPGAVAFDGDGILVAATSLARSDDAGQSWTALAAPGAIVALASHPARSGRILAALDQGIALSDDGGQTWEVRSDGLPGAKVLAVAMAARAPDTFYAALQSDGLWMSEDAGRSWRRAMDRPLGTRLAAEAVGTFLFFFLGFSGVAVVVDIGADAITPLGVGSGFPATVFMAVGCHRLLRSPHALEHSVIHAIRRAARSFFRAHKTARDASAPG